MRWQGRRESENVEDVRGTGPSRMVIGGGIGTIVIVLIALFLGADPRALLMLLQPGNPQPAPGAGGPVNVDADELDRFIRVVLADTEDVWTEVFEEMGRTYRKPTLRMFTGSTSSGCGFAGAAMGPFYCPADEKVYIDLGFYEDLKTRFHAPGDFAQAYVIAHEVGHHVQNLLGTTDQVQGGRGRMSEEQYKQLSVRLELQADFYAGIWARRGQEMKDFLEEGDIKEALRCASAIGDDTLQKQAQGYVVPDSFTHGTSEQRMRWFLRGFETGDMSQGDTFRARSL
jgi:hypothetical protein